MAPENARPPDTPTEWHGPAAVLLDVMATIMALPDAEKAAVRAAGNELRRVVQQHGAAGPLALALVGAMAAVEAEQGPL